VCADISSFSSYQVGVTGSLLMANGSHARVLDVGGPEVYFGKDGTIEARAACPIYKKESC
jgi:hypothetical protein